MKHGLNIVVQTCLYLDDDRLNGALLNKENAPVRVLYPAKEASMNTENYNTQAEFNKIDVRLWWDTK